jgi:RHS repeat-associated protein
MPFGEELVPDGANRTTNQKYNTGDNIRQKFTGYQKDTETQLDFAEARMYENRHGRFTAVDPLLASGKSANPQTFNRYVYVMNNPLIFTDPSGLQTNTKTKYFWIYKEGEGTNRSWKRVNKVTQQDRNDGYTNVLRERYEGNTVGGKNASKPIVILPNGSFYYPEVPKVQEKPSLDQKIARAENSSFIARWFFPRSFTGWLVSERGSMDRQGSEWQMMKDAGNFMRFTAIIQQGFSFRPNSYGGVITNTASEETVFTPVTNSIPQRLARVLPGEGPFTTLGLTNDVFVTAAEDIAGMNASQLAPRLGIPKNNIFTVIEFPSANRPIASPVFRTNPGFIGRGLTSGGAREFVIPNEPIPENSIIRTVQ